MHHDCTGTVEKRVWKGARVRLRCRKCGWTQLYRDPDLEPKASRPEAADAGGLPEAVVRSSKRAD